jgi:hypothetical protein
VVTRKKTEADVNNAQERMNRKSKVDASPDSDAAAS